MSDSTVPGTPDGAELQLGEHTGAVQPDVPPAVPATAAPSVDQVTVNTHLRKVGSELESVVKYVEAFLSEHPVAGEVVQGLESVITVVAAAVK